MKSHNAVSRHSGVRTGRAPHRQSLRASPQEAVGGRWVSCEDLTDRGASGKASRGHQGVKAKENGRGEQERGASGAEGRAGKELSSAHSTGHLWPRSPPGQPGARLPWNSSALHVGLPSPAGAGPGLQLRPLPRSPGKPWRAPPPPRPQETPRFLPSGSHRAKTLPLGSHPRRPQVLKFKLRDCQGSSKTAEYFSEGGGERERLRGEGRRAWKMEEAGCGFPRLRSKPAPVSHNKGRPQAAARLIQWGPWPRAASPP